MHRYSMSSLPSSNKSPWLFALLVMILVFATEQLIEYYAERSELAREKSAVDAVLSTYRARLEGVVNANLLLVQGLTAVIAAQPEIDQTGFARIARNLVNEKHALRNIAGAPDMVVSLMYPLMGNEAAIGLDYRTHPTQSEVALRVMRTGQPGVAGPLSLMQGGVAIVAREPVFVPVAEPGGKLRFWGLVSAVIDVEMLYRQAGLDEVSRKLRVSIRGTDGTGAEGPVFFGHAGVFELDPVTCLVSLPGGAWQMAAAPVNGWGASSASIWMIRLLGLLAALTAGVLAFFLVRGSQALSASEARLRALLGTIPDLVWLKDLNGVYLACNARFESLYGAKEAEIVGKTDYDFVPTATADFFRANDRAAIEANSPKINEEWLTFAADGHREFSETIKAPVRDAFANLVGVLGIARDVTERKANEQRIEGLNRVYAVLSGINEAIVRLRDQPALFAEACRIAVELGGFRMAWLGMADPDSGEVRPLAHAGKEDGYIENIHISLRDDEFGRGPTGTALRQGRHVVCNDIASDSRMAPWRDKALALGYHASAAFPIRVNGEPRGVFSLYADEAGFFDAAELHLLDELALDIGFALEFIEVDNARDRLNQRMLDLLESMSDGFVSIGEDWCYQYVNHRAGEMLGRPAADLVGKNIWSEFPELVGQPVQRAAEKAMRERVMVRLEEYFPPWKAWFDSRCYPTCDGISVFFADITERKQAEETLRQQRDMLDRTSRLAHVGGWQFDVATLAGHWSDETARIHGVEPSQTMSLAESVVAFQGPARVAIEQAIKAAIDDAQPYELELEMTAADGVKKWVRTIGLPVLEGGRVVRLQGATQDVSKRKLAEAQVKRGDVLLDSLFQALPDLFFLMDNDGIILDYRASRDSDLYLPAEAFLGKRMQDVVPINLASLFDQHLAQVRQRGGMATYEYDLVMPHGTRRFEARLSGLPDSAQFIAVVRDITERTRMENEIRQINAELEQRVAQRTAELAAANNELETFTYSVSHDLKAPLRGIDGYSRLLLEDHLAQLDEEGRLFLGNVRHGVEQMSELIEDLLAYSRMERRNLLGIRLDLSERVAAVLRERADDIAASGVQISLALEGVSVQADPEGLAMVLRNLIDNALKFSRDSQPPMISISAEAFQKSAILAIKDNGIGFDMQFEERIFAIFQRLQRAENYPGTGVGLAIVRKAMQRMGGRVWVESAPGQGATFYLELPL